LNFLHYYQASLQKYQSLKILVHNRSIGSQDLLTILRSFGAVKRSKLETF